MARKRSNQEHLDQVTGPDRVVDDICRWLQKRGWSWSRTRDGLSRCSKMYGGGRRKPVMVTIRIGAKGRRNDWAKGEISVGVSHIEWSRHAYEKEEAACQEGLLDREYKNRATTLIRDAGINHIPQGKDWRENFYFMLWSGGPDIPQGEIDLLFAWLEVETLKWDEMSSPLADQVDFLLEEGRNRMLAGYL